MMPRTLNWCSARVTEFCFLLLSTYMSNYHHLCSLHLPYCAVDREGKYQFYKLENPCNNVYNIIYCMYIMVFHLSSLFDKFGSAA